MRTPEYLIDVADKAARCTLGQHIHRWMPEDWDDARHEALVGILHVLQRDPQAHEGILFLAGKTAIYDWMRQWLRHPRGGTILDYVDYAEDTDNATTIDLEPLRPLLAQVRVRKRKQAQAHIQRDIAFLSLMLDGYSMDGIAAELGIKMKTAYAYRSRLKARLEDIANGVQRAEKPRVVPEKSLENIRRVNSDPELRKQRGNAIRAALAKKKAQRHDAES